MVVQSGDGLGGIVSFSEVVRGGAVAQPQHTEVDLIAQKLLRVEQDNENRLFHMVFIADFVVDLLLAPRRLLWW